MNPMLDFLRCFSTINGPHLNSGHFFFAEEMRKYHSFRETKFTQTKKKTREIWAFFSYVAFAPFLFFKLSRGPRME